jgi:hypothetical protein
MRLIIFLVRSLVLLMSLSTAVCALEIQRPNKFQIELSGPIEPGDFSKVETYLLQQKTGGPEIEAAYLSSPGGNLVEAMRLGNLLRELLVATVIETNDATRKVECSGACFLVFAGVIQRSVWWFGGNLPAIRLHLSQYQLEEAQLHMEIVADYLRQMGVADGLIQRIAESSPAEAELEDNELRSLNGIDPAYQNRLRAECGELDPDEQEKYAALLLAGALNEEHPLFKKQAGIESCRYALRYNDRMAAWMNRIRTAAGQAPQGQ